ncbi:nucleotidyltransferase family protein [Robertmurraya sp.]|uniref:nucleotidyltransferase domain-containing protein n=1 Tax=Robertmurraya sp. TaxID=2837525 RepID=UPI003703E3BD
MNNSILNIKGVSEELLLITNIINSKALIDNEVKDSVDWNIFVELILHHRLHPYIYPILEKYDGEKLPPHIKSRLKNYYVYNTFQMLHLSGEMDKLAKIFMKNDIKSIFLKGPFLGSFIYGDVNLRTSSDLDILISIDELEKVESLIVSLGFEKDDYIKTVLNDWKWRHHHFTFINPNTNVKLEIHWRLNPGPAKEPTFKELWERRKKCQISSNYAFQLGEEDMFLFLVTHGARHGWSRLRWLLDIHYLTSKNINWDASIAYLNRYKLVHLAGQALILSKNLFNTKTTNELSLLISDEKSNKLAQAAMFYIERMVNLHSDPLPLEISNYHKKHLFDLMSPSQKFLTLLSHLHPYPIDVETLPLPKQLHILYFPLRPLLWALRKKSLS